MHQVPIVALLTDFGLDDAYVGTMKGVILSICPSAQLVDLTHTIEPQNIRQAAYVLLTAYRYFPPNTVFVVVVDPGVGTTRQPVAVETEHGRYVAPDNGVLSYVLAEVGLRRAILLHDRAYHLPDTSLTFHGRDIFGPAAAHLANGVSITDLGPPLAELVRLPEPALEIRTGYIAGEVLHIDHFGNMITSIGRLDWHTSEILRFQPRFGSPHSALELSAATCQVELKGHTLQGIRATYGAVPPGAPVALVGSAGQLEVGINQGHAARLLGVSMGDQVNLVGDFG